jgi:hypothetical protein
MAVVIDGTSGVSSPDYEVDGVTGQLYPIVRGTAVTASGTSVDFTGIPSWVKRITVMFNAVSTNGTSNIQVQLGDAGGVETSGYLGAGSIIGGATAASSLVTTGFATTVSGISATVVINGSAIINCVTGNTWASQGIVSRSDVASSYIHGGSKALSDTLTQVRITTVNGTDTFDAGTINILYE